MRALTLRQPWAYAVTHLGKRVENRSTKPDRVVVGDDIAIHAGRTLDEKAAPPVDPPDVEAAAREIRRQMGCIVAVARVLGYIEGGTEPSEKLIVTEARGLSYFEGDEVDAARNSHWRCGPVGIVLGDVRVLAEPVPCKGALGYWTVPADVEARVLAQVPR